MVSNLEMREAAQCNRVPMTVERFAASDLNGWRNAYWFSDDAYDFGLDPWAAVEGVDPHVDGVHYDVWFESGKTITVPGRVQLFVPAKHLVDAARGAA